jgi:pyruvate dehydrogenase E2 component (dihydrolipoamide acetyltransferase)
MPSLADSMEQGTIARWLRGDGERVEAGEDLVEIETDKASMTCEAEAGGILRILATEGTTLRVGEPIARIGEPAEIDAPETHDEIAPAISVADTTATPRQAPPAGPATSPEAPARDVRATPLARLLARAHQVDLASISGTGPRGRVTRFDVANSLGITEPVRQPAPERPSADIGTSHGDAQVQELSRLQHVVARRMTEAQLAPAFHLQAEVLMDAALALRAQLTEIEEHGRPSLNDFVVKAAALALRQHPRANGSYAGGRFLLHARINVGVAVAAKDALVVPTVTDTDTRSLSDIAAETRRLAERVRTGTITLAELEGGSFTVSNLGMFGMSAITPLLNPPQAAILGVGAIREVAALRDGELVNNHPMTLTLTCDHRILYGADAAQFLSTIRELLERPLRLVP